MTAPSYVNSGTLAGALGTSSGTPALPGSLTNGNFLTAWIWGSTGGGTVSLNATAIANGWALGGKVESANGNSAWAWRLVDGAEAAPQFDFSVSQAAGHWQCDQYTGNDPVTPVGVTSENNGSSATVTGGTVVTTGTDSLVVGHLLTNGTGATPSTPTNYTSLTDFADADGANRTVAQTVVTLGGTSSPCNGTINSAPWTVHVFEILSDTTPPVPPDPTSTEAHASQFAALVPYSGGSALSMELSELVALIAYAPVVSKYVRASQMLALVPYAADGSPKDIPRVSQLLHLVVWGGALPNESRSRAWWFVLDGHPMYVLDLGEEGTFIYDLVTKQWSNFVTEGHIGWNMKSGTMWGATNRILGGDATYPYVWELVPDEKLDEGFRTIKHVVTGGVMLRSRVFVSMAALRVAASSGQLQGDSGAIMNMRFSDDNGKTWSVDYPVELTANDYSQELAWRSLGSFMAPGRTIELSDDGGLLRIDGADAFIDNFDAENLQPTGGGGGNSQ